MKIVCKRFFLGKYMYIDLYESSKFKYKYSKYSAYDIIKI